MPLPIEGVAVPLAPLGPPCPQSRVSRQSILGDCGLNKRSHRAVPGDPATVPAPQREAPFIPQTSAAAWQYPVA